MGKEREREEYLPRHPGIAGMEIENHYFASNGTGQKLKICSGTKETGSQI